MKSAFNRVERVFNLNHSKSTEIIHLAIFQMIIDDEEVFTFLKSKLKFNKLIPSELTTFGSKTELYVKDKFNNIVKIDTLSISKKLESGKIINTIKEIKQMVLININSDLYNETAIDRLYKSNSMNEIRVILKLYRGGIFYGVYDESSTPIEMYNKLIEYTEINNK